MEKSTTNNYYPEQAPDSFMLQDEAGKIIQLSSAKLGLKELVKIAKEFIPNNKTTKPNPDYT